MGLTGRVALGSLGGLMLLHAGYSAFEALTYEKSIDPTTPLEIPLDITVETVVSVILLCIAVISGSAELKPVRWREWADRQEKENSGASNILEHRPGFLDIRAKRREFLSRINQDKKE